MDSKSSRPRVALYSHDTMGLGHIRRNIIIGQALARSPLRPEVLLITGTPLATAYSLPHRISCLALPSLHKETSGKYRPQYRGVSLQALIDFRSSTIRSAIEEFHPDVFIVDKVPRGALRELDFVLEFLRGRRKTHCVLGLRDILDDPSVVQREWEEESYYDAIRDYYDSIWVYGDPRVYDPAAEYNLPRDIAEMITYTGYLDQRMRIREYSHEEQSNPYVLCLVGGGQDGASLVETFARCELPSGLESVVVSGPFMPRTMQRRLDRCSLRNPSLKVYEFLSEPALLVREASRVIAMGGYNTLCEIMSFEKIALIVPRVVPRREQCIRAERLRDLGFIDVLNWEDVSTESLTKWLNSDKQPPDVRARIDMNGLERIPQYLSQVLADKKHEIFSMM